MMQQYEQAKAACGDAILLFRMGDFYELFHDDATIVSARLGLTLTTRDKGANPVPMAGFPHHQLDGYLARLIKSGFRVAICEQVEDPATAKGLVRREVTRVVTPGTVTDHELLDPCSANFLMAIVADRRRPAGISEPQVGVAWIDVSTGLFQAGETSVSRLGDLVERLAPAEILVAEGFDLALPSGASEFPLTRQPDWASSYKHADDNLRRHFGVATLDGFGFGEDVHLPVCAAGSILTYLRENQPAVLDFIDQLQPFRTGTAMEIDQATWRSLEITRTIRSGQREGSLFGVIDRTVTSMGSRQLGEWLQAPLLGPAAIGQRLDAVDEMVRNADLRSDVRNFLKATCDVQRLLARIASGRATPRDLSAIGTSLAMLPALKKRLENVESDLLRGFYEGIDECADLRDRLERTLESECPLNARDGGFIRAGCDSDLDEFRTLARGGKEWIARYQARISQETGISGLKVGFNNVFGYYIEVTNLHRDKLPAGYIRKQTLKNAERFITPELKEYEEKVLSADQQALDAELRIFGELRDAVAERISGLKGNAAAIACLDAVSALAELAATCRYVRPRLTDDATLQIINGRHPVLDITRPLGSFVPNSTCFDEENGIIHLVTGPNMAGKSTYIRQTALIVLLAHIGSFVPADSATIGLTDRLFARVGASDELSRGQSTFMVEMSETARILNTATPRSLVILDEIGRGTSTYDGVSLAWAIVEYLHDRIGCRTLFATHYHELTRLEEDLPRMANYNVSVREWNDTIVFLHKIVRGAADRSYGIHVARLAGVPGQVNRRAEQILQQLEGTHSSTLPLHVQKASPQSSHIQLTLFDSPPHPLLEKIRRLDTNHVTPMGALELLQRWQSELEEPEAAGQARST
jgi:DNA mismatch repair protein MutS